MRKIRIPHYATACLTILAIGASANAHAQLGAAGRASSASQGDVVHQAQSGLVKFHETTDADGIVVREYVDSSGTVYAVSWRGPAMPDVRTLLGSHFETFRQGASASVGDAGLHAAHVAAGDLVVENRTRLREFIGRAWLASALPPGVSATDIQ
ncbi:MULTISPECIES: DUF2844 domain-containing protein [Caballeronia]|uniref:DUF2844 domain-containing protein n=1 Tax=Caballeronia TaxID=1827195 RepID=UPI001588CC10|nr:MULTISPECIES: DUF2844 domain-containing protein [Caballeronia]MCG7401495.1 DUF2844 domain-containing protein [Caballeronia zhejiangensis]MCI1042962.1 DUF2844 domain-containing protein [Caballeronia zhejiangensis]